MKEDIHHTDMNEKWRKTDQHLLPLQKKMNFGQGYDIYPAYKIADGQIFDGYSTIADALRGKKVVAIDGYNGVFFSDFIEQLDKIFKTKGICASWILTSDLLKSPCEINELIYPFTGKDDPLFGKRATLTLKDFFNPEKLENVVFDATADIDIVIGPGASLVGKADLLLYVDIPKNELQFRMRSGAVTNLGADSGSGPRDMYKRSFFVDWVVLNRHKENIFDRIDIFVDGQRPDHPVWMRGEKLRKILSEISRSVFRVRPWFEPGAWGGTWIKDHLCGLPTNVPNYAWSFELITPENGLLIESSSILFEISFDSLMFAGGKSLLGDCYNRFGNEFPIRFDFLDTFDGGNLSLQCHPRPEYIFENFGESFTQEETYYILDTKDNAVVFLGFNEDIDSGKFESALLESVSNKTPLDTDSYIQKHPASKHDLFLIPYGTIHGSGKNNLVLEISTTPYIYTFKMYDWLRMDLDGKPRPLNIKRGMDNLFFDRKGSYVTDKLISKPHLIDSGSDWQLWHLPTHETHLYDVHRYVFRTSVEIKTGNKCLVMSLVEGQSVEVECPDGYKQRFNYAETFVVSAALAEIKVTNLTENEVMLVKAFVK
jgi:hypothetical protein